MEKETFSFILENISKLEGFDIFLIFVVSLFISSILFVGLKWLYSSVISNQKELIEAKEKLANHYKDLYQESKVSLKENDIQKAENSEKANDGSPLFTEPGYYLVYGNSVKIQTCFYILQTVSMLKSGLWVVIIKSRNKETVAEAQKKLDDLEVITKYVSSLCYQLGESIDKKKHSSWQNQYAAIEKAVDTDLAQPKLKLQHIQDFIEQNMSKKG